MYMRRKVGFATTLVLLVIAVCAAVQAAPQLYICDSKNQRVVGMDDMYCNGWVSLGSFGSGPGQFNLPSGIGLDSDGRIYVADSANGRIVRIDDMTGSGWTAFDGGADPLKDPLDVFVDDSGRIFISDSGNHRIVRIDDMTGSGWAAIGTQGSGAGQFDQPVGIWVDDQERIYVADELNHRIVRMDDMAGNGWTSFGAEGSETGQFRNPTSVCVDCEGRIHVADHLNSRLVRIDDMSGRGWADYGPETGQLNRPSGVFAKCDDGIYVVDRSNCRVVRIEEMDGAGLETRGRYGSGACQFDEPTDLWVAAPKKPEKPRTDFGLSVGLFSPADSGVRALFDDDNWLRLGLRPLPTRVPEHRWQPAFDVSYYSMSHERLGVKDEVELLPITFGFLRGFGREDETRAYVAVHAGPYYGDLHAPSIGVDARDWGLNINATVGVIFDGRYCLEGRYDFMDELGGFDFSAWSISLAVKAFSGRF